MGFGLSVRTFNQCQVILMSSQNCGQAPARSFVKHHGDENTHFVNGKGNPTEPYNIRPRNYARIAAILLIT